MYSHRMLLFKCNKSDARQLFRPLMRDSSYNILMFSFAYYVRHEKQILEHVPGLFVFFYSIIFTYGEDKMY